MLKKILAVSIILILAILSFSASQWRLKEISVVCDEPYIHYGDSCCMDANYNRVCDDREPSKTEMITIEEEIVEEVIVEEEPVERIVSPEVMIDEGEGKCGDGVCTNLESQNGDVFCNDLGCVLHGQYTENLYSCPRDCGIKCPTTVFLKMNECIRTGDIVEFQLENYGGGPIAGISFIYEAADVVEPGDILKQVKKSESGSYDLEALGRGIGYERAPYLLNLGDRAGFQLDVGGWESKLGSKINKVQIIPYIQVAGISKECSNQKLVYQIERCLGD